MGIVTFDRLIEIVEDAVEFDEEGGKSTGRSGSAPEER